MGNKTNALSQKPPKGLRKQKPATFSILTVWRVTFSVEADEYNGTNPLRVNGIDTPIFHTAGDNSRSASVNLSAGAFRIDTWPEVTALQVTFANNDGGSAQALLIDQLVLEVTHTTSPFAPPTWSDEFNDSSPPNPAV